MEKLQVLGFGTFLMFYYYFVLRKYNTLGFRLFSLFFFISIFVCCWWYSDDLELQDIEKNGVATEAMVIKKSTDSLFFRFVDQSGKQLERAQTSGISVEEFASVSEGKMAPVLYSPKSDVVFLASSYKRQLADNVYILFFPGMLFLIGSLCWFFLRKYRVYSHEGTIYEYVVNEEGKIVLDDARSNTTKALRNYTTFSKLFSLFEK